MCHLFDLKLCKYAWLAVELRALSMWDNIVLPLRYRNVCASVRSVRCERY